MEARVPLAVANSSSSIIISSSSSSSSSSNTRHPHLFVVELVRFDLRKRRRVNPKAMVQRRVAEEVDEAAPPWLVCGLLRLPLLAACRRRRFSGLVETGALRAAPSPSPSPTPAPPPPPPSAPTRARAPAFKSRLVPPVLRVRCQMLLQRRDPVHDSGPPRSLGIGFAPHHRPGDDDRVLRQHQPCRVAPLRPARRTRGKTQPDRHGHGRWPPRATLLGFGTSCRCGPLAACAAGAAPHSRRPGAAQALRYRSGSVHHTAAVPRLPGAREKEKGGARHK